MRSPRNTAYDRFSNWLYEHPGWWTRSEICAGAGLKKTSQSVRAIERMVVTDHAIKTDCTEQGRFCWIYSYNGSGAEFLPF
jgi:hypothetical protein